MLILPQKQNKGFDLQLDLDKIGIFKAPYIKTEQNRYQFYAENENDKLEYSEQIMHNDQSELQIFETDHFVEYAGESSKDDISAEQEEEKYISAEPSQNIIDNEQSGSDNNEELDRSPPKIDNSPILSEQEEDVEAEGEGEAERFPILFLDVNLGKDRVERLVIYEGDDPYAVADQF